MKRIYLVLVLAGTLCSCANDAENAPLESIDSSVIMNDSTRLPNDSTATTVTQ